MRIAKIKTAIILLFSGILLSQCTKFDTTSIGSELIPGADNIHTFDTLLNVVANNFDDVETCDSITVRDVLASGIISDNPLFGSALGEMYFEMKPSSYPIQLPPHNDDGITVDSVVMVLNYIGSYGDSSIPQKVDIYPLGIRLDYTQKYSTCNRFLVLPGINPLGSAAFVPQNLKDSIHVFREDAANQLRIKLDNSFGENIINNAGEWATDSAFMDFFQGFAVVPDQAVGGNALNYFSTGGNGAGVRIYTRSSTDNTKDTSIINLTFTTTSAQANYIQKVRGSSEITQNMDQNPDGDSLLFVQTYPEGSYVNLKIQGLSTFPNSVISRAELVLEQEYDPAATFFDVPLLLYIDIKDSTGNYIPIPCDFTVNEISNGFFNLGGTPQLGVDEEGNPVFRFKFNIPRYIQSVITRKEENVSIRLRAPAYIRMTGDPYIDRCNQQIQFADFPSNPMARGGVKLKGTGTRKGSVKLHMIYSSL